MRQQFIVLLFVAVVVTHAVTFPGLLPSALRHKVTSRHSEKLNAGFESFMQNAPQAFRVENRGVKALANPLKKWHVSDLNPKRIKEEADLAAVAELYQASTIENCLQYTGPNSKTYNKFMRPNALSRIRPLGLFNGSIAVQEYFNLACPTPNAPANTQVQVTNVDFINSVSHDGTVWFRALFTIGIPADNYYFYDSHIGYCVLDDNSKICACETTFIELPSHDPEPVTQLGGMQFANNLTLLGRAQALCDFVYPNCTVPALQVPAAYQYHSIADCYAFITQTGAYASQQIVNGVPTGPYRMVEDGYTYGHFDSMYCREFHKYLILENLYRSTPLLAGLHCGHSGPTGNGFCDNADPMQSNVGEELTCATIGD